MKRSLKKTFIASAMAVAVFTAVPLNNLYAFGLPSLGGSKSSESSDVNWKDLASNGSSAEKDIYVGSRLLAKSTITMAEALGYKKEAAALQAQVDAISEDGSISGDFDLGETSELSGSVFEKISSDKQQLASLDAGQKEMMSKSMSQYAVGGVRYIKGVKKAKDVASKAADAPMTQMSKFSGIIKLAPTAARGAKDFFGKIPQVVDIMTAEDIAMPDNINDIKGAASF